MPDEPCKFGGYLNFFACSWSKPGLPPIAAELKDELLYSQGLERPERDFCPICTLPIPLPTYEHSVQNFCCSETICCGCDMTAKKRGMNDCAFCRTPKPDNNAQALPMVQARVEKKDPAAVSFLAHKYYNGELGLQQDFGKAFELYTVAAELGSVEAIHNLGGMYGSGRGVQQDMAKCIQLYEKSAMQGFVDSRFALGIYEIEKGNPIRAMRHFLISAKMGHKDSLDMVKNVFMAGVATKEQYTQALKAYQDAVEETKSYDRDKKAMRLGY